MKKFIPRLILRIQNFFMEHTYEYAWIIPFISFPVPMLIGAGLILFPTATKRFRRMWAFQSVLLLFIVMMFSIYLSIQQINSSSVYQYVWSWIINNDFSLDIGYLIDPLTSIMSILFTTVGIMVLIYNDKYMAHDQGYLRFFSYISFFNTSMLVLLTSSNLIQIYMFWELVGLGSYLLVGFWFIRPIAANACQKEFVTNRVGDFVNDLFKIFNNLIYNNELNFLFVMLCVVLLFAGAVAKSAQFPLHVMLPDAMEESNPISALTHAATMVAAGIFLYIGIITILLGPTLVSIGLYDVIFLGSESIMHSMETIVGYSSAKSQNMGLIGGLRKHVPIPE
uniref:Uncharacterized protein n=1 Tax=Solanum lycopersicum TaxID=4081 RepID=A0A3Q7EC84_SOLLC